MFIKLYSKVNRDHCVASFINFKSIIIRGENMARTKVSATITKTCPCNIQRFLKL